MVGGSKTALGERTELEREQIAATGGWAVMAYRLGDINYNGKIDNGEVAITTGPDMIFGNDDDVMCDGTQLQQIQGPLPPSLMPK